MPLCTTLLSRAAVLLRRAAPPEVPDGVTPRSLTALAAAAETVWSLRVAAQRKSARDTPEPTHSVTDATRLWPQHAPIKLTTFGWGKTHAATTTWLFNKGERERKGRRGRETREAKCV